MWGLSNARKGESQKNMFRKQELEHVNFTMFILHCQFYSYSSVKCTVIFIATTVHKTTEKVINFIACH